MKGPIFSKVKWILGGLLLIAYAQNCTKAEFAQAPNDPTFASPQGEPEIETGIPVSPTPVPTPSSPYAYPELGFDYVSCAHNSLCPKKMMLSEPDGRALMLKWKTNEFGATSNPSSFCQPATGTSPTSGYKPASGSVTYQPGETEKTINVFQVACAFNQEIPITITECYANGVRFDCMLLK